MYILRYYGELALKISFIVVVKQDKYPHLIWAQCLWFAHVYVNHILSEVFVYKLKEKSEESGGFCVPYKHLQTTSFVSESEENVFSCDLWYCYSLCHIYVSS